MDVIMPQLGETVEEGTVSAWHKKVGDRVGPEDPLFEVETDKAAASIPAQASGVLAEILVPAGSTVKVGTRLAVIRTGAVDEPAAAAGPSAPAPAARAPARIGRAAPPIAAGGAAEGRLSPVVRRLLAEHGLDPAAITGTGEGGRVTRKDVTLHLERMGGSARAASTPVRLPPGAGDAVVPMSRIRRITAARVARAAASIPHVLQAVEVDFSAVEAARRARGPGWKASRGFTLSYLPFVARAVCRAIPGFPHVNASVRGDELVVHGRIDLGIAVSLEAEGLVVPVVRDAGARGLAGLALEMHRLAEAARRGALGSDELSGGTYTLSNSGSFGTLLTAPIIREPEVAILSTDGVRKRPVVVEGPGGDEIAVRPVGVLAQCFDHRAFDGAYSAAFLRRVKEILEAGDWIAELQLTTLPGEGSAT
jgi:pyruvate dehydrogenase E2 component (dihydrolipoamide acetyltransferase)